MIFIASILMSAFCASMTSLGIVFGQALHLWHIAGTFEVDFGIVGACAVVAIASGIALVNESAVLAYQRSQVRHHH